MKRVPLSNRLISQILRNEKVLTLFPGLKLMAAKQVKRTTCGSCHRNNAQVVNQAREFIVGRQPSEMAALKTALNMSPADKFYMFHRNGRTVTTLEM